MRRTLTAAVALAALAATVAPVAASSADAPPPSGAVLDLTIYYSCYGCGTSTASVDGSVVAGNGKYPIGGSVTGAVTVNAAPSTCPVNETATGTLSVDGVSTAFIAWFRVGATALVTTADGGGGAATMASTTPGLPCGGPLTVTARFVLTAPDSGPSEEPAAGASAGGAQVVTHDVEYGSAVITDVGSPVARSNHEHTASGRCDYTRSGNNHTVSGHATLGHHLTPQSIRLQCEVFSRYGNSIVRVSSAQAGSQATVSGSARRAWVHRNKVCLTIEGIWNDGHVRYFTHCYTV